MILFAFIISICLWIAIAGLLFWDGPTVLFGLSSAATFFGIMVWLAREESEGQWKNHYMTIGGLRIGLAFRPSGWPWAFTVFWRRRRIIEWINRSDD